MTRILGVDPGYATCGWGVIDDTAPGPPVHVSHGCVATPPDDTPLAERIGLVVSALRLVVGHDHPTAAALEDYTRLPFGHVRPNAVQLGQAVGEIRRALDEWGLAPATYGAMSVKRAIAGGRGVGKGAIQSAVRLILKLPEIPTPTHAADALAVAILHSNALRRRRLATAARR